MKKMNVFGALVLLLLVSLVAPAHVFAAAKITIVNANPPGVGFNDPTPVAPLPTNPGTTFGAQALNVFQYAADIWGATLDSPVEISIRSLFMPLACNATSGVLGSAGPWASFGVPNYPTPGTTSVVNVALRNKLAGFDVQPTLPDIQAQFNSNIGTPNCLPSRKWYMGLDTNTPVGQINLAAVLLHEFAHGLGFTTFAATSVLPPGLFDVYARRMADSTHGSWMTLSPAQRQALLTSESRLVFDAPLTNAAVAQVLSFGAQGLRVTSPATIAATYKIGVAQFGPALSSPGVSGRVVVAVGPGGATNGCAALTNASAVAGNIALIDGGTCGADVKTKNAQDAGAVGVVIADNITDNRPPVDLAVTDPLTAALVAIPAVQVTNFTGVKIKANVAANVQAIIGMEPDRRRGADLAGRAMLYAPDPFSGGSSIGHFDTTASRNLLMEPFNNIDVTHSLQPPFDLTATLMQDIGWFPDSDVDGVQNSSDNCPSDKNANQANNDGDAAGDVCDPDDDNDGVPDTADNCQFTANSDQANHDGDASGDVCDADDDNDGVLDGVDAFPLSDMRATVIVAGCDSGSPNLRFADGSTLSDLIGALVATAKNHGNLQSSYEQLGNGLVAEGKLTGAQKAAIGVCVAQSRLP